MSPEVACVLVNYSVSVNGPRLTIPRHTWPDTSSWPISAESPRAACVGSAHTTSTMPSNRTSLSTVTRAGRSSKSRRPYMGPNEDRKGQEMKTPLLGFYLCCDFIFMLKKRMRREEK